MTTPILRARLPLSVFTSGIRLLAAIAFTAAAALAADPQCKSLADASSKYFMIPTHIYSTETAPYTGGKPRNTETIYLNNKTYTLVNGRWRLSPVTPKMMLDAMNEAKKDPNTDSHLTCRQVRDEAIDGEEATLYSEHSENQDGKSDSHAWVSKSRGLLLKLETERELPGVPEKVHRVMRFEYSNVQAPPGVQ